MAESNNEKILDSSFYEIDFIEVGGQREGKPGKGADWVGAPSAIFTVVVALLVIYANSKRYTERANDLKANCIDLDNLLKELEIDSVEKKSSLDNTLKEYANRYTKMLGDSENHTSVDLWMKEKDIKYCLYLVAKIYLIFICFAIPLFFIACYFNEFMPLF